MVSTTIMLLITGGALTTFKNALAINDTAAQLADANQNLRAGTNQLIRDLHDGRPHHRRRGHCRCRPAPATADSPVPDRRAPA